MEDLGGPGGPWVGGSGCVGGGGNGAGFGTMGLRRFMHGYTEGG